MIVRFSWVLDFGGDSWNSRLTTNVPPVLSELFRRLSRWREEELDGRVSDVFETLPDSARLRELDPPEELGRSRSLSLRSLLWPSRLMPRRFAVSSFALRRPRPAVARPVGAGPFRRRDAGSHGLGLR